MRSQRFKDFYFSLVRPVAASNGLIWGHRLRRGGHSETPLWLNLGSGAKYLDGFVNIEGGINRKRDMWLDLRNEFPFPDGSVDAIYTCHVLEHFYLDEARRLLLECKRVLKPDAGIRIVVPSAARAVKAYVEGDSAWFSDFPESQRSLGGRLYNYLLCAGQHRLILDGSFLEEILEDAGFSRFAERGPNDSEIFATSVLERFEAPGEVFYEDSLIGEAFA